jgi:hypothetical protein
MGRTRVVDIVPGTRRQRKVNWGDAQTVQSGQPATLFMMNGEQGTSLVLTIECVTLSIPDDDIGTADFRPYALVSFGNGGSDVFAEYDVTHRVVIPIVAASATVQVVIRSLPLPLANGTFAEAPVPAAATASFRGFASQGTDGQSPYPTRWVPQMGANQGAITDTQARLTYLHAFAVPTGEATGLRYLQLFDTAITPLENGAIPVHVFPVNVPSPAPTDPIAVGAQFGETRGFVNGLAWALSTTPYVLTLDAGSTAFVAAELQQ